MFRFKRIKRRSAAILELLVNVFCADDPDRSSSASVAPDAVAEIVSTVWLLLLSVAPMNSEQQHDPRKDDDDEQQQQ